jgi:hypothetical protein
LACEAGVVLVELAGGGTVRELPGYGATGLQFAPGGRILAAVYHRGIVLWDVATGAVLARLRTPTGVGTVTLTFAPDGSRLVSGHSDTTFLVWPVPPVVPLPVPSAAARERAWEAVNAADAARGDAATWTLSTGGDVAVHWLRSRLRAEAPAGPAARVTGVLERIGTPAALKLLEDLAGGPAEAPLTREAGAAAGRIRHRPAAPP